MKKDNKIKIDKNIENGIINDKNEQLVKVKAFSISKFVIKLFAAAILISFAILIFIRQEEAQFVIMLVTGSVCAIAACVRIIPLLKTLQTHQARMISFIEILFHLAVGAFLIISAFTYIKNPEGTFGLFVNKNFHLFVAVILYTRALSYFWVTVLYKERTTKFNFWLHIIVMTLAVIFAAIRELSPYHIAIGLGIISLIAALYLIVESGGGYWRYRKSVASAKKKEEEQYHKEDGIQAPAKDENKIINEIDPAIIPTDEPTTDSSIVS